MKRLIFFLWMIPLMANAQISYNMSMLSNVDLPGLPTHYGAEYNDCWGYRHANGTEIAIIGGMEQIFFVNITNPQSPVVIYTYDVHNSPSGTTNVSLWRDFKTYQNYVYAVADEGTSGLLIFDMSNVPTSVTMVKQTTAFWARSHNIFIDEPNARLYAAGPSSNLLGIVVLNLAVTPADPTLIQMIPLDALGGGYVHDIYVRDNIAYCSLGGMSKLQMYDLSNLPNISIVGTIDNYPEPGYNHSSWLNDAGNMLVMVDETHGSDVKLIDISDPTNISSDDIHTFYSELLGAGAPGSSIVHNPFVIGNLVYLSYYHDGVQVFDISDPANITLHAYYDTCPENVDYFDYEGCWGVYPFFPSGNIIASDQHNGLFVLHIDGSPLAVHFISFDAFRQQNHVQLNWSVADAVEADTFDIKRSQDRGITFTSIGHVPTTAGHSTYTFTDVSISDYRNYVYRIDLVQQNGNIIRSPLRSIKTYSKDTVIGVVNPMEQELVLDFNRPVELLKLQVYDISGKLAWSQDVASAQNRMNFDLSALPAGQYLLTLRWPLGSENVLIQKVN